MLELRTKESMSPALAKAKVANLQASEIQVYFDELF